MAPEPIRAPSPVPFVRELLAMSFCDLEASFNGRLIGLTTVPILRSTHGHAASQLSQIKTLHTMAGRGKPALSLGSRHPAMSPHLQVPAAIVQRLGRNRQKSPHAIAGKHRI
jgi:hypothetical protein